MSARFSDIKALNLGYLREEVSILRVEIRSLTESTSLAKPPVIPLVF